MENKFEQLVITNHEFNYLETLDNQGRLDYLFSIYDAEIKRVITPADLAGFFEAVKENLEQQDAEQIEFPENASRVDVMIDDDNIMIEANSLRAIRIVVNRFIESGYILRRDVELEKSFRKDKVTRYMRVFYIVDQITGICSN
jgi:hypothetical protein